MDKIAYFLGDTPVYWSSLVIIFGAVSCFLLTLALYTGRGGKASAVLFFMPIAAILGIYLARALHCYCHPERYQSLASALGNLGEGEFCLAGVHAAVIIAVIVIKLLGLISKPEDFFDCLVPGYTLLIAMIRLSAYFNTTCRSKIIMPDERYHMLPFASPVTNTSGVVEWRFATFFIEFLLLLAVFAIVMYFYANHRKDLMKRKVTHKGNTALMFLLFFSAVELILDSTRYDASFAHFNAFVSITQMVSAVSIIFVLVIYSIRSIRANGLRGWHFAIWFGFLAAIGGVGASEYLVQRHGDWYRKCYAWMALAIISMVTLICVMYNTARRKKPSV